jgi:hypothetical protein
MGLMGRLPLVLLSCTSLTLAALLAACSPSSGASCSRWCCTAFCSRTSASSAPSSSTRSARVSRLTWREWMMRWEPPEARRPASHSASPPASPPSRSGPAAAAAPLPALPRTSGPGPHTLAALLLAPLDEATSRPAAAASSSALRRRAPAIISCCRCALLTGGRLGLLELLPPMSGRNALSMCSPRPTRQSRSSEGHSTLTSCTIMRSGLRGGVRA